MSLLAKIEDQRIAHFFSANLDQLEYAIASHAQLLGGPEYDRARAFGNLLIAEARRRGYEIISYNSLSGMGYHVKFVRPKPTPGKTSDLTIGEIPVVR